MTDAPPLLPVVAAALFDGAGRVLVQQRGAGRQHAGLWEFPGGKVEPAETPEAALVREIAEELGVALDPAGLAPLAFASRDAGTRHILLLLYAVRGWAGDPQPLDAAAIRWVDAAALAALAMPPADVALRPAVIALLPPRACPASIASA